MHAESDAFSRGEILSLTRKLITRIKAGIFEDQAATKLENAQQLAHPRQEAETKKFLNAYVDFLRADLRPAVSYPRHITALRALALFLESGVDTRIDSTITWSKPGENNPSKFTVEIFSSNLLRLLVDLLLDSFEDVRATSLSILEIFPRDILIDGQTADRLSSSGLTGALSRAEQLASNTSRADHADTVARLYHLLFRTALPSRSDKSELLWWETKAGVVDTILGQLEAKLSTPGGLFTSSLRDAPLHGFLSALR